MINEFQSPPLTWHIVERAIYKEMQWLKDVIDIHENNNIITSNDSGNNCHVCSEYLIRKIALKIIDGSIKAYDIKSDIDKDLWDGLSFKANLITKHRHGNEWHRNMMNAIDRYFAAQGFEVITEPYLNLGRADLGIYEKIKRIYTWKLAEYQFINYGLICNQ